MQIRLLYIISILTILSCSKVFAIETVKLGPKIKVIESRDNLHSLQNLQRWEKSFVDVQMFPESCVGSTPRVIADKSGKVVSLKNDEIYINRLDYVNNNRALGIYRIGAPIKNKGSRSSLGIPFYHVADATYKDYDIATKLSLLELSSVDDGVIPGDRVLNKKSRPPLNIREMTDSTIDARILHIIDSVNQATKDKSVILNIGFDNSNIHAGDVLSAMKVVNVKRAVQVYEDKFLKYDNYTSTFKDPNVGKMVTLPEEPVGNLLVYDVFDKTSVALVLTNTADLILNQKVSGYVK